MKLGELIEARRIDLGGKRGPLTMRELQARARAAGYRLTDTSISRFVKHPLTEFPGEKTMEALAVALEVDFDTVVDACAESRRRRPGLGEVVAESDDVRAWTALSEGRTAHERALMIEAVRTVAAALDAAQRQERAANSITRTDEAEREPPHALRDVTR